MNLTLKDVLAQAGYLVISATGVSLYPQEADGDDEVAFEYDNGTFAFYLPENTPVESLIDGSLLIAGCEYKAYIAQQIKFNTEV